MKSRSTRIALGLVGLIPVIGITGGVLVAVGAGARATAWISVLVGLAWLIAAIVWALAAPPARPDDPTGRNRISLGGSFSQHHSSEDRDQGR